MNDKLVYSGKYDSVDSQKVFKQNDPRFFIPILKQLGSDNWRFFLSNAAVITKIKHYYLAGVELKYKTYSIGIKKKETKGNTLVKDASRPAGIECRCDKLIEESDCLTKEKDTTIYRGILYGSIRTYECSKDMDCPDCKGTGTCSICNGEKEIICSECDGNKECSTCAGTGYVKCPDCDGTGTIECDNCNGTGSIECNNCNGTGKVDCWICNGSGECPDCYGLGGFANGADWIPCKTCHGTGECNRCHGRGDFYCQECDGDGEFECQECDGDGDFECHNCNRDCEVICPICDGSRECVECNGTGIVGCPECDSTGNCINCNGTGKVVCSRCDGTGYYQTYMTYEIRENEKSYSYAPVINMNDYGKYLEGVVVYDDIFFKSDSGEIIIDDVEKVISFFDANKEDFNKWISKINVGNIDMIKAMENKATITCFPVTEVTYKLENEPYTFYVMGTNNVIAYYKLPPKLKTIKKGIFNF